MVDSRSAGAHKGSLEVAAIGPWILEKLAEAPYGRYPWNTLNTQISTDLGTEAAKRFGEECMRLQRLGLVKRFSRPNQPGLFDVQITPKGRAHLAGQPVDGVVAESFEELEEELNYADPGTTQWEWAAARIQMKSAVNLARAIESLRETAEHMSAEGRRLKHMELWVIGLAAIGGGLVGALVANWLSK